MRLLDYNSFINQDRQKVKSVNEHLWSGIIHRSETGKSREEDKIRTKKELQEKIQEIIDKTHPKKGDTIDLNHLDVSRVEDMSYLFNDTNNQFDFIKYNFNISNWDVSNVEDMRNMFDGCENFNSDLSRWKVSKVMDMCYMFNGCENFNSDLSGWDVSKVMDMSGMFFYCKNFNCDLSRWNVSKVMYMDYMFQGCENFNSDLSRWDVSSVTSMRYMFSLCKKLDCDFSQWNLSKLYDDDKIAMFFGCDSFDDKKLPRGYNKLYRVWTYDINVYDMLEHIVRTKTIKHEPRDLHLQLDKIYESLKKWYEKCSIKKLTISAIYDYYGDPDDEDEDIDNQYGLVDSNNYITYDEKTCFKLFYQFVTDFADTNKYFRTNRIRFLEDDFYSDMKDYICDIFQEVDKSDFDK